MSKHLLMLSLGPVQKFIAAARSTSDLYAGSRLLAELSAAAAKVVAKDGELIFPADEAAGAANVVLAALREGVEPASRAAAAKEACISVLRERWQETAHGLHLSDSTLKIANEQIESFLEFYAAWVPLRDSYSEARRELASLLAGRKALRDFRQLRAAQDASELPGKRRISSLDPSRLSLPLDAGARARLHLKKGERLDAVSLIKRQDKADSVPSTSMMALRSLEPPLTDEAVQELGSLAKELGLGEDYSDLLYPERFNRTDIAERIGDTDPSGDPDQYQKRIEQARRMALGKRCPPAYYAILAADGDRMGKLLDGIEDSGRHRDISRKLAAFAEQAKKIVDEHAGFCIYSGGDDALALLPLHRALACAKALRDSFAKCLDSQTTLSVGIAFVHHLEDLQTALEYARAAESEAKKSRDALAVAVHTRGGAPLTVAERWDGQGRDEWNRPADLLEDWDRWIGAFGGGLARGFPYELMNLVDEWQQLMSDEKETAMLISFAAEIERIYRRKEGANKPPLPIPQGFEDWQTFARKLVIARFLAGQQGENNA